MFGHTLLRIDTREGRDLLGWAVNFAGATGNDGGIVYAARGLTGGYQGYFSVVPYYEKVKSYGDWENRDIWEYDLALTPDELRLLIDHLWELEGDRLRLLLLRRELLAAAAGAARGRAPGAARARVRAALGDPRGHGARRRRDTTW